MTPNSVKLTWVLTGSVNFDVIKSFVILFRRKTAIDDEFEEIPNLTGSTYTGEGVGFLRKLKKYPTSLEALTCFFA